MRDAHLSAIRPREDGAPGLVALAQSAQPPASGAAPPAAEEQPQPPAATPPKGTVLFERHDEPVVDGDVPEGDAAKPAEPATPKAPESTVPKAPEAGVSSSDGGKQRAGAAESERDVQVSDAEREALTFVGYDLDAHVTPAKAGMEMHARVTVRNDGSVPLTKLVLQVSSALNWERFTVAGAVAPFVQHVIDTDADHTGQATEAIVTLKEPLEVGKVVEVSAFYSGRVERSRRRLEGIGAPAGEADAADWDAIGVDETALRGFGNVLWYPVSAAQVFLGDGAALFQAVGKRKLEEQGATVRLRLTMEYTGEAPKAAYFCGRMAPFTAVTEDMNAPAVSAQGIAVAEFEARALGFRVPSLFVTNERARAAGGVALSAMTQRDDALGVYGAAAEAVAPMLQEWIADTPAEPLNILDHRGQTFEEGTLLVTPMEGSDSAKIAGMLSHGLTHAWFSSQHAWLNEGVAQLMGYLWTERTQGRDAVMKVIAAEAVPLAFVEPAAGATGDAAKGGGQSLIDARDDVYYRTKAAAVLWMLRSIAGDESLKQALHTYTHEERRDGKKDDDPKEFQRVLEAASHRDLGWFFDDWVYRDRGLPELSIESVNPRQLTAATDGRNGWLVAVVVHNAGDAAVEVPVTVRSGTLTATERIRVLAGASTSTRILFQSDPEQVVVNDGSVPEVGVGSHVKLLKMPGK